MTDINKIIIHLIRSSKPFNQITDFSDQPGIYAFFFYGKKFPIEGHTPRQGEIIYIGKTESSQQKRDADTHFATGKTGSSTVRKSFGSLLIDTLKLKPEPRSQSDIDAGRTFHFKFDHSSEERLTSWMKENLGLSFYEYKGNVKDIELLETRLIQEVVPVINIDKNHNNPYLHTLKKARKEAASRAYSGVKVKSMIKATKQPMQRTFIKEHIHKYEDLWKMALPQIIEILKSQSNGEFELRKEYFDQVGNRKSYSFNLELKDGRVVNNIGGSAVARDLARVMLDNNDVKTTLKGRHVKIRMDKQYTVYITIN
jgi:hypothetical protein